MTEHCNHECVCKNYSNGSGWGCDDNGKYGWQDHSICKIAGCEDDTRNQPDPLALLERGFDMTDQKPNCSTCTLKDCPDDIPADDFGASGEESVNLLKKVGCISHPDARAYLMADVIEKLLMAIQTCDEPAKEEAYEYAITLIRDGVK
jgi:hypothetical protein